MGIRRRGRSSWEVAVELGRDPLTGRRRRLSQTVRGTQRDAERVRVQLLHQIATGLDLEPTRLTVGAYLKLWLETIRPNLGPTTYCRYEGIVRLQVLPGLAALLLAKLRPLHIQGLYSRLRESGRADGKGGLSPRTLLHVHRVLYGALGTAVRWQIIPRNVCQAVEAPKARWAEMRTLSREDTRRLLDAAHEEESAYGDAVIMAVHTGLRLGELLGLRWEDVDLERGALTVRRTLQYLSGEGLTSKDTKTARARRTIPLGPTAVETLRRLRRRQLEERLAQGSAYCDRGIVFADALGRPLSPYRVSQRFPTLVKRLGLVPLRFHDLRHTHASLLLARGVHPKIVSERLGHASIAITLDTYSHVLPNLQEEAARDLDAWLADRRD